MPPLDAIRPKIAKCIRLLASNIDREALGAVRALGRTLTSEGLSFNDLGDFVERGLSPAAGHSIPQSDEPETWSEIAAWCRQFGAALTAKEASFIANISTRLASGEQPSEKQGVWLEAIYGRLQANQNRGAA